MDVSTSAGTPAPSEETDGRLALRLLFLFGLLYVFFVGLDLMGLSFKLFGKGLAETLIERTSNPFVGLFIGILATTLVQSSSTTTSMTVGLVAGGALTIEGAIPIIMGANIGTSVTNTIVSLGHVTRPEEFRRAFAGATVHDIFNWMAVAVLLPIEISTGFLARSAGFVQGIVAGVGGTKLANPLKEIVRPVAKWISHTLGDSGILTLAAGVFLVFLSLKFLVDVLKSVFSQRAERLLHRTLFRSAIAAIGAGCLMTAAVQSSSITTSVVIPLVGAGVVSLEQLFPFTIGANIGTTVTAMLAALATGTPAGITVALSHLFFNLSGALLVYPFKAVRGIPLTAARALGRLAVHNRLLAGLYIVAIFYLVPLLMLFFGGILK